MNIVPRTRQRQYSICGLSLVLKPNTTCYSGAALHWNIFKFQACFFQFLNQCTDTKLPQQSNLSCLCHSSALSTAVLPVSSCAVCLLLGSRSVMICRMCTCPCPSVYSWYGKSIPMLYSERDSLKFYICIYNNGRLFTQWSPLVSDSTGHAHRPYMQATTSYHCVHSFRN